jgi:hypothetical protein
MNKQPNFNVAADQAAIPGSGYDNLSDADLQKLINETHRIKTGHSGSIGPVTQPKPQRHVDIDALIEQYRGK